MSASQDSRRYPDPAVRPEDRPQSATPVFLAAMAEPPDWPEGFTPAQTAALRPILSAAAQQYRESQGTDTAA